MERSLQSAADHKITIDNKEYQYTIDNEVLKLYAGKQAADGVLPQCKTTIFEILLPLIAYLSFFSGILQLLIDSGAAERVAKLLSPIFVHVFPEVPRGHPSISYMTLNFAANFLGLDSAATPFGLKAMESLQELNDQKDRASNPQIMFMCLHAAGLTLLPTSIIGYRAAQHATNPADVMLPCIITSFIGTVAALVVVGIRQRINLFKAKIVIAIGGIVCPYHRVACLYHAAGSDQQKPFHRQPLEWFTARPYLRDSRLQLVAREAIRGKGHDDLQFICRRRIQRADSRAYYFPVYPRNACRDLAFSKQWTVRDVRGRAGENVSRRSCERSDRERAANRNSSAIQLGRKPRIPARRDGYVRRGLVHRSPRLRFSMRSGDDVLRPRRLLRECENQEYPLRAQHDATRRPDLRVRGDLRLPGIL